MSHSTHGRILVTGATGYVGGRLVPRLLEAGYQVRCLVRSPRKLADRPWFTNPSCEVAQSDLGSMDVESLASTMRGCVGAYYLVHSMLSEGDVYRTRDRTMAEVFARAAEQAELSQIIYLGGLGELGAGLSEHLESRREVGAVLASGKVPVTQLRAAMIIGSGSASFEILRYLVERLPIMVTPKWVSTECQPIAISNVVEYLLMCLSTPETRGNTLDIGGPDVLSYAELLRIMAVELRLPRRIVIPVPVLTPKLSSLWIHLVTPLSKNIAMPLAEGLRNRVVCRDDRAARLMPQELLSVSQAMREALQHLEANRVDTTWSMAGPIPGDPDWSGGKTFVDERSLVIDASAESVFRAVTRIGGGNGWYAGDLLWRIRGWIDRLLGGPGLRRGRRDPERVAYGEALDFWRVTEIENNRRLVLHAEMKLPGKAVLEFKLERIQGHPTATRLYQTARFLPRGLAGLIYWYAVLPFHSFVFQGMLNGIGRAAREMDR